jgi:hypothetical protein
MELPENFNHDLMNNAFKPPEDFQAWIDKMRLLGDVREVRELALEYSQAKVRKSTLTVLRMKAKTQMWLEKSKSHTVVLNRYTLGEHFDVFHQLTTSQMVELLNELVDDNSTHITLKTRKFKTRNTFTVTFHKLN